MDDWSFRWSNRVFPIPLLLWQAMSIIVWAVKPAKNWQTVCGANQIAVTNIDVNEHEMNGYEASQHHRNYCNEASHRVRKGT